MNVQTLTPAMIDAADEYLGQFKHWPGLPAEFRWHAMWDAMQAAANPAPTGPTVEQLQRELLAICRGGSFAEAWRKLNAPVEWPSFKNEIGKVARLRELRRQIAAIDPNAALYYGWGGSSDDTDPRRN